MAEKMLVIDDDQAVCRLVQAIFSREGLDVSVSFDGRKGLEQAAAVHPDVVLLDLHLPGLNGMEALGLLRTVDPSLPVVMFTGSRDVKDAVRAIQLGAFDYLTKPIDAEEIVVVVRRALETRALKREVEELRRHVDRRSGPSLAVLMGPGPQVAQIDEQVSRVATSTFTVLILGETGTGKELVAQAIHRRSDRSRKPFVALDCGAIPEALMESELFGHERGAFTGADRRREGRLRLAEGGTCFLDEVGNLPATLQAKLLRVLESRQVQPVGAEHASPMDVRFVAATNDDLQQRVAQGMFRADLYFRLAQYAISIPALRERSSDIDYLAQRFIEEASLDLRRPVQAILPDALELLRRHPWPGNVRELRNVIRQAVLETSDLVLRATVVRALLDDAARSAPMPALTHAAPDQSLKQIADDAAHAAERQAIKQTLRATHGNKSQTARLLKTDFKTLHLKMRAFGIESLDFQPAHGDPAGPRKPPGVVP